MSSTSDAALERFFRRRLSPAAQALRDRSFDPLKQPENASGSWYIKCGPVPEFTEVEAGSFRTALEAMWLARDLPELAALAGEIGDLAEDLRLQAEETTELSPFMYVMY